MIKFLFKVVVAGVGIHVIGEQLKAMRADGRLEKATALVVGVANEALTKFNEAMVAAQAEAAKQGGMR